MSPKSEKSTKPMVQSTPSVSEEWRPMLEGFDPSKIVKDLDEMIENNRVIRLELQELKDSLEEKRGKLEEV